MIDGTIDSRPRSPTSSRSSSDDTAPFTHPHRAANLLFACCAICTWLCQSLVQEQPASTQTTRVPALARRSRRGPFARAEEARESTRYLMLAKGRRGGSAAGALARGTRRCLSCLSSCLPLSQVIYANHFIDFAEFAILPSREGIETLRHPI